MTYPLPVDEIINIAKPYKEVMVIEELDPFMEDLLLTLRLPIKKRPMPFYCGELNHERIAAIVHGGEDNYTPEKDKREGKNPPAMCSGCPHFTIFNIFRDLKLNVSGDIGCYTLAALPPFKSLHSVVEMGASIPMAMGAKKLLGEEESKKTVAVIGDSTFFHSGITGLLNTIWNQKKGLVCILDNDSTAMTGRQEHPGTGGDMNGNQGKKIDYMLLLKSMGVSNVVLVDAYEYDKVKQKVTEAVELDDLTVMVIQRECALMNKEKPGPVLEINNQCTFCGDCLKVGCPSISLSPIKKKTVLIDPYFMYWMWCLLAQL